MLGSAARMAILTSIYPNSTYDISILQLRDRNKTNKSKPGESIINFLNNIIKLYIQNKMDNLNITVKHAICLQRGGYSNV